jgi:hypothetical protein
MEAARSAHLREGDSDRTAVAGDGSLLKPRNKAVLGPRLALRARCPRGSNRQFPLTSLLQLVDLLPQSRLRIQGTDGGYAADPPKTYR